MARKKQPARKTLARRLAPWIALVLLSAVAGLVGWSAINASTLHVRRAEVTLEDLPAAFDGRTLLYISDIDICGLNTAKKSAAAVMALQSLRPDLLLLGGDYTSTALLDRLNHPEDTALTDRQRRERTDFFLYIKDFSAPLGKFAIAAPDDGEAEALRDDMAEGGLQLLDNTRAPLSLNGQKLWLAGITATDINIAAGARTFREGDCVICAACSPACFPQMMVAEAVDGGHWVDLALAGHTHGGQIRLFGRNAIPLTSQEMQYLSGWTRETGVPMLTTSGLGCEGVNLRFGTMAEAWLITLSRKVEVVLPDLRQ